MAVNFPGSLDVLPQPTRTTARNASGGISHGDHHRDLALAVMALEAKVGVTTSAVSTSLDYFRASVRGTGGIPAGVVAGTNASFSGNVALTGASDTVTGLTFNSTSAVNNRLADVLNSAAAFRMGLEYDGTNIKLRLTDRSRQSIVEFIESGASKGVAVTGAITSTGGVSTTSLSGSGAITFSGVISPAQITSDQNNYNPSGVSTAAIIRLNLDAARTITGLVFQAAGRRIMLVNTTAFAATLAHNSASSAEANRFACPASGDFTLRSNASVELWYDSVNQRWRVAQQ